MDAITMKNGAGGFEPESEDIILLDLLSWSEAFSCGIKIIDDQHKELVNLINEMFHHVSKDENEEREYFEKSMHQTVKYTEAHFKTEEKLMSLAKVPGYKEHKNAHETFEENIACYIRNFEENKSPLLLEFANSLKEWFLSHTAVKDKEYFDCFKKSFANQLHK